MTNQHPPPTEPNLDESIIVAQYSMLAAYMPHMYIVHIISGLLIAELYSRVAPPHLVFPIMSILLFSAIFRLSYWLNPRLPNTESIAKMKRTLREAPVYGAMYFTLLTYWILSIAPYGGQTQQLLAAFYIAIGTFCGISFNANLPRCVYAILLTGSAPLIVSLIMLRNEVAHVFAALYLVNIFIQVLAVRHQHRGFVEAVRLKLAAETSRRDAEVARRAVARLANTDALTGLPNRRYLIDTISERLSVHAGKPFAFGMIDLDDFKPVNDIYGHAAGDEVISTAANRLSNAIGTRGIVARLGGDEFGFILFDAADPDAIQKRAKDLISIIEEPIPFNEAVISISGCCGILRYPEMATAPTELFQRSDEALYEAKRLGRGMVMLYDKALENRQTRRHLIEARIRVAIAEHNFDLAFQPIRELSSDKIVSYEALARWNDPVLGSVPPSEFIPIAEQSGLISALSDVLLERALREAVTWPPEISLSFNLSTLQIYDFSFALHAMSKLSKYGFPPERLLFEVTETALLTDIDRAALVIQHLRDVGIRVALDDFGVGYAGFSYLSRLTVDNLKIDRSFISGIGGDRRKRQIVKAIVRMCHSLQIKCIAEGVESEAELTLLKAIDCDAAQGYLLGRPGPAPRFHIEPLLIAADG